MPTAVDVLERIDKERQNKFANEVKPMINYISQMQELKAQQRQREEAKEDYAWEIDTRMQKTEEQRKAESQRIGNVAKKYYAGGDFRSLLESGEANLEDLDKIRNIGQDSVFKGALGELDNIQSTNPNTIAINIKEKYPDIDDSRLNLLTEAKLQRNYNNVYKDVIKSDDKLKSAEQAYIDGKINYSQYDEMIKALGETSKIATEMTPVEEGAVQESILSITRSPEFKNAVSMVTDPNEKMQVATDYLAQRGVAPKNSQEEKNLRNIIGAWERTPIEESLLKQPETFKQNYIMGKELVMTGSERQQNWKLLADTQLKNEFSTSIGTFEDSGYNSAIINEIEKMRKKNKDWINKEFKNYGLDENQPINKQLIDMDIIPALLNALGIEED